MATFGPTPSSAGSHPRAPRWLIAVGCLVFVLGLGVVLVVSSVLWFAKRGMDPTQPAGSSSSSTALGDERARHLCTVDGWCAARQRLPSIRLLAVDAVTPSDIWAVGELGSVWHYNGQDWGGWLGLDEGEALTAVRALGPRDVWAVSKRARALHFDGTSWKSEELPIDPDSDSPHVKWRLTGWSDDLWLARENGYLLRRRGGAWTRVPAPDPTIRPETLVVKAPGEVWLGGERVVRYAADGWRPLAGSHWTSVSHPRSLERLGDGTVLVYPGVPGKDLLAVVDQQGVPVPAPPAEQPVAWCGSSARDLWVIGWGGPRSDVYHWDGSTWKRERAEHELHALVSLGPGSALAVGEWSQRRYLGSEPRTLEIAAGFDEDFALARGRSGGPELWVISPSNQVEHWKQGVWTTLRLSTSRLGNRVAVSPQGDIDITTQQGPVWHADAAAPEKFTARPNPFAGVGLTMVAHDEAGAPWILSRTGGVARWAGGWETLRQQEREVGDLPLYFHSIAFDASGGVLLSGDQYVADPFRRLAHFVVHRGAQGWEKVFPPERDFEACRVPRYEILAGQGAELLAASGTPRRPCLLRWQAGAWSETPLLVGPAGTLPDSSTTVRAEELIVLHAGPREVRNSYLALRRADGWHLQRAPFRDVWKSALDPGTQRAWLLTTGILLDFVPEETWRTSIPTLVSGQAEAKVPLGSLDLLATPSAIPELSSETTHGDAWSRAMAKGRAATVARQYPAAIEAFDAALAAEPHEPRALAERGYARIQANDLNAAEFDLRSAQRRTTDPALLGAIEHNFVLLAERRSQEPP